MTRKFVILCTITFSLFFSCAAIMSNIRSSSSVVLQQAPYYQFKNTILNDRIGHLPIQFDERLEQDIFIWGKEQKSLLQPLVEALNKELNDLNTHGIRPVEPIESGPQVFVGNAELVDIAPAEDEEETQMIAKFTSGTKEWNELLAENMLSNALDYVLNIQLGFSEYLPRQTDWKGSKVLELGTGYSVKMKWLSDLNTGHEVLHLTGVLLDRNGKAVRYGSEAIIYETTDFAWSLFDVQEAISDEQIQKLLTETKRADLTGSPLNWQAALQNLVAQLTGQQSLLLQ